VVWRLAADVHVVMLDRGQALVGHAAPARHVAQERHDLRGLGGAAEAEEQNGIDGGQAVGGAIAGAGRRLCHGFAHLRLISWTQWTSRETWPTGVSGRMPWPKLKMWPGRPAGRFWMR